MTWWRRLLVACSLVVWASSTLAAGEWEALVKQQMREAYLEEIRKSGEDPALHEEQADAIPACAIAYALQGLTSEEINRFDIWAVGGLPPDDGLVDRVHQRLSDAISERICVQRDRVGRSPARRS